MTNLNQSALESFNIQQDSNDIFSLIPKEHLNKDIVGILEDFTNAIIYICIIEDPAGIVYECPIHSTQDFYKELFEMARDEEFTYRLQSLLKLSTEISRFQKPIVAIINTPLNSIQMAPMLWATHIVATKEISIQFPEASFGLFPGLGTSTYIARQLGVTQAAALLIKASPMSAQQAYDQGLFEAIAKDSVEARELANRSILVNKLIGDKAPDPLFDKNDFDEKITVSLKKSNRLYPGINLCIKQLENALKYPLQKALELEVELYVNCLHNLQALAIMRTMNYGIQAAKKPTNTGHSQQYSFEKIGVLGAGMMGAGIAFEVAKAGIHAALKDTTMALANKGKAYSEKCCDKLIQLGKMTETSKEQLLSYIQPTNNNQDLTGADLIIEAVFEDKQLKGEVISETAPLLNTEGIFASNTTSLPIAELAGNLSNPGTFIGMHFFSPVDRMPLVEIIMGQQTSKTTLDKALSLVLKLGKVPIVVHDSPAFFTSRIFFNYLLEALTMLLEGVSTADIEKQAIVAGFAVSPLAVLDEISLPLMIHVYEQLPALSDSQKRAYDYLRELINQGRTGRKSGKGFYDYALETGQKQYWQDPAIPQTPDTLDALMIRKRLLHVMALDSYRCLEEGILDRPIDGDIGSILGVGYAAHTGGVIAYIDQIGIRQFIKDCDGFSPFGQQWEVPESMRSLAARNFTFYNGFDANWPKNN